MNGTKKNMTQNELLKQVLAVERSRLTWEKKTYATMRKLTQLFELAMKVNSGALPLDQLESSMNRINETYRQRTLAAEQSTEGIES